MSQLVHPRWYEIVLVVLAAISVIAYLIDSLLLDGDRLSLLLLAMAMSWFAVASRIVRTQLAHGSARSLLMWHEAILLCAAIVSAAIGVVRSIQSGEGEPILLLAAAIAWLALSSVLIRKARW